MTEAETRKERLDELRREVVRDHIERAREAMRRGDWERADALLERAHIVGQPSAVDHVRAHLWMLVCGWKQRDGREIVGQLWRLLVAGPASLTGRYPRGNTGRANVSAFVPMPIPSDLRELLDAA